MLIRVNRLKLFNQAGTKLQAVFHHSPTTFLRTNLISYGFQDQSLIQAVNKHLNNYENKLKKCSQGNFKFQRVIVPRFQPSPQQIQQKLQTQWKNKRFVFNIDPSGLIGAKRLFMKHHLQNNVYDGSSKPDMLFSQINPSIELSIQQVKFDDDHFLCDDVAAKKVYLQNQDKPQEQVEEMVNQTLIQLYDKQPQRYANRLKSEYRVTQPYTKIIELASYQQIPMYFCGINQYSFRTLISRLLTLNQVKQLFMTSLKFAASQSYKYKMLGINSQNSSKLFNRYNQFARQLIYLNNYSSIKRIQNGEIIRKIPSILNEKNEEPEKISKRRRNISAIKNKSNIIVFSYEYTANGIQDYVFIKDFENYDFVGQASKPFSKTENSFTPIYKEKKSEQKKQRDTDKIQKHAILQVMLGKLWSQPYTFNPFPYLSENYHKLSTEDKQHVRSLFNQHLVKYSGAVKLYYEKNINKLDSMQSNQQEIKRIKLEYQEKKRQYERSIQLMKQKKQEAERLKDRIPKSGAKDKNKDHDKRDQIYKQNYEEDPEMIRQLKKDENKSKNAIADAINNIKLQELKSQQDAPKTRGRRSKKKSQKSQSEAKNN